VQRVGHAGWALMSAIHDALRQDLDEQLRTTASRMAARARWIVFRGQLSFHLAAEQAAMWPLARAKLAGSPDGQALLDAMEDEHQLIGPLQAVTDDAFTMDADPHRLRQLLTRLRTRLASHLAHEADDDGLRAVVAELEAAEPVRPLVVEETVDADLVAGRPP
jgi:Hemerythrin HHE cation binding domain